MATFVEQVEALTSLDIDGTSSPNETELTQFLKDGVLDVTKKCIKMNPVEASSFQDITAEQTSQGANLNGAEILTVLRESGTDNDFRPCRRISPDLQSRVTDIDSIYYASAFNPVYAILEDGKINVYPEPNVNQNAYKVYYVNNSPQNASGTALDYSHSDLKAFPDDKVYLVVVYAAIKSIEHKIGTFAVEEEDSELVQAFALNLRTLQEQYANEFTPMRQRQSEEE